MTKITIFIVLLAGCAEYDGLWVHKSCSDREYQLIETAVDKFNIAAGDEELVYVAGWVNEDDFVGTGPKSRDVVRCLPEGTDLGGHVGEVSNDDIYIISREDDCFLGTMMHELGHLYAGAWHVADADAIMYRSSGCRTEYNDSDIREFRLRLQ